MKKIKQLTSKTGEKMVIAQDKNTNNYSVFTLDEWQQGKDYRYPEFDDISDINEALSQAKNY